MHTIRLRGAWETTHAPDAAHTRHARNFGRPRTLDPNERLWLVCARVPAATEVLINDLLVATFPAGPLAADITHLLQPRNTVALVVASPEPIGEVALEVRTAAD